VRSRKVALIMQPSILPLARSSLSPPIPFTALPFTLHSLVACQHSEDQSAAHLQSLRRLHSRFLREDFCTLEGNSTWRIQRLWTTWQSTCWGAQFVVALSPPLCLYLHKLGQPLRSQQAVHQSADGNSGCVQAAADTLHNSMDFSIYCSVFQA